MNVKTGVKAYYQVCVKHSDGTETKTGKFSNLLTNRFFQNVSVITGTYLGVGIGTTPPTVTDLQLESQVGGYLNSGSTGKTVTKTTGNTFVIETFNEFTFGVGAIVGNISELALKAQDTAGENVFSRALIKDAVGTPITLNVTIDDQLIVTWFCEATIDATPIVYPDVDVNGVLTDITLTPWNIEGFPWVSNSLNAIAEFFRMDRISVSNGIQTPPSSLPGDPISGSLPGVGFVNVPAGTFNPVDNDNCQFIFNITVPTNSSITAGSNLLYIYRSSGSQTLTEVNATLEFDPPFVKTEDDELTLRMIVNYSRP